MPTGPDDEDQREDGSSRRPVEELDGPEHSAEVRDDEERADADTEEEQEEWRFSVDDFPDEDESDDRGNGSNVAGTLEQRQPLEPGDIDLENALFVALGVFLVLGLIVGAMLGF